jgi:hypothetical protein
MSQAFLSSAQAPAPFALGAGAYLIAPGATLRSAALLAGGSTVIEVIDPPEGHRARFDEGDILRVYAPAYLQSAEGDSGVRIAAEFWSVGAIPSLTMVDVWLRVTAKNDRGTHFAYDVDQVGGPACQLPAGTRLVSYGPPGNRLLQLNGSGDDEPYVDLLVTGDAPWDGQVAQSRLGRLDELAVAGDAGAGLAVGQNLADPATPYVTVSELGLRLSKGGIVLRDGQRTTVRVDADGGLRLGVNVDQDETTAFVYSPATESLDVRVTSQLRGVLETHNDLLMRNGASTTARIAPSGEFALGPNIAEAGGADVRYDPAGRVLQVAGALQLDGAVTGLSQLELGHDDVVTARFGRNGDVRLGADVTDDAGEGVRFALDAAAGTLAIQARTTVDGELVVGAAAELRGGLRVRNGDVTTALIEPSGALRIGPNVAVSDETDVHYDPETRIFRARTLALDNGLTLDQDIELRSEDRTTVRIGRDGSARFGTDLASPESTGVVFDTTANQVTFNAPTALNAAATVDGPVTFNQAAVLRGETTVHRSVRALDEGAFAVGANNNIVIDREGITMRLMPGENNSVKVLGVGRAALVNAYQTTDNVQQFDVLAYYSRGVPSVHGSLRLGVSSVDGDGPDVYVRLLRYNTGARRIDAVASIIQLEADSLQIEADATINGNFEFSGTGTASRVFQLRNLPIRPTGLPAGAVWNDGGTLKVVV